MFNVNYIGYLALVAVGILIVTLSYSKGVQYSKQQCIISSQKASDKLLSESLTKVQEDLRVALEKQAEGSRAIAELTQRYNDIEKDNSELQSALHDAINKPPVNNKLDPRYYRLYQQMYNREPPPRSGGSNTEASR